MSKLITSLSTEQKDKWLSRFQAVHSHFSDMQHYLEFNHITGQQ